MKKIYLLIVAVALLSSSALADQITRELHITRIFAEGANGAGFYVAEPLPECQWGIVYIDLSKESGKAIFSLALAAKTAREPVVRIDYSLDSIGKCRATGLHTAL